MLFPLRRPDRAGLTVALDIGSRQIKVVAASQANGCLAVSTADTAATPRGAANGVAFDEPTPAAPLLRRIAETAGLIGCPAVSVIGGRRVILRWVTMPPLPSDDAAAAARTEAAKLLPMPLDQAVVDVHLLPAGSADGKWSRGLVVAAPKSLIEKHAECIELAGLKPAGLDVIQLALLRAMNGAMSANLWYGHPWATVALGASTTELLVTEGCALAFCRTLPWGTDRLSAAAGIEPSEAASAGGDGLAISPEGELLREGRVLPADAQRLAGLAVLSGEINRSLIYYQTQFPEGSYQGVVGKIVLTAGGAVIPGILSYLARELGTTVELGDPFPHRELCIEPAAFRALRAQPTAFAPCLGLLIGGGESNGRHSRDKRIP